MWYVVIFDKDGCKITNKNNEVIATGTLIDCIFELDTCEQDMNFACAANVDAVLWHRRLGHIGLSNMNFLNKSNSMNLNMSIPKILNCVACVEGKQSREPFNSQGNRASKLLEIVHSDVCGPMSVNSIGGARFFVSFIDDFSRKTYVDVIKRKSDVFDCFVKFKVLVENQLETKIKTLRSDGGLEYCNNRFRELCEKNGIIHQTTAPYTPQQNGLAERMNRTIIEKVRCMLSDANLSKGYWAEAVTTAVKIINMIPNSANKTKSPDEIWYGKKPDLSVLRVFGCTAMALVPNEKRKKLEKKSMKCIFVGYQENSKAYRLYNTKTKKI